MHHSSIHPPFIYPPSNPSANQFIDSLTNPSIHQPIHSPIHLEFNPSIYLFHLPTHPSIHPHTQPLTNPSIYNIYHLPTCLPTRRLLANIKHTHARRWSIPREQVTCWKIDFLITSLGSGKLCPQIIQIVFGRGDKLLLIPGYDDNRQAWRYRWRLYPK